MNITAAGRSGTRDGRGKVMDGEEEGRSTTAQRRKALPACIHRFRRRRISDNLCAAALGPSSLLGLQFITSGTNMSTSSSSQ